MTKPNAIFIHAAVDEAGLTAAQFRVLCHVGRRGECYEAVANMATHCRLHADTVRKSLKELVRLGWLHRQQRTGTTSIYEVCHSKIREHPIGNRGSTPCEIEGGKVYPIKVNPNKDERAYRKNIKALDKYGSPMTDDEYLVHLSKNPKYKDIDIQKETAACQQWCVRKKQIFSRRRLTIWLDKADKPMFIKPKAVGPPMEEVT